MALGDLHLDTFSRTVGAGDWGTSDDGHTYTETTAANFSTNGSKGLIAIPSAGALQTAVVSGMTASKDVEVYAEFDWSAVPAGAQTQSYLFARYTDGSNHYRMQAALSTAGNITIKITRVVGGVATDIHASVNVGSGYTAGQVYAFRFRITGTDTPVLQGKGWLLSGSEPAAWTLNDAAAADSSPYNVAGTIAVRHQQNAGGTNFPTLRVDNLSASTVGATLPPPPSGGGDLLHDTFSRTVGAGDWGTADDGHTYTETTAAQFSVASGKGVITLPSAAAIQTAISNATAVADVEVYAELAWGAVPVGAVAQSYLIVRQVDASNHYRLKIQQTLGAHLTLNVTRRKAAVDADVYTTAGLLDLVPGTFYSVRFRVTGGATPALQARIWERGTPEPTTWTLNDAAVTDPDPVTGAGSYGVRHQMNSGGTNFAALTLSVDALDVYDLTGVTPPDEPPPSSGAARLLVFGDNAANTARVGFVRAAGVARLGATPYVPINVGDNQYDGGWYREMMQTHGWDADMGALNAAMRLIRGNHDVQNPVGGPSLTSASPLAKWVAQTAASAWNNADKLCVPTTAAKANGFYYKAGASGTTGSTEPNWNSAVVPGATLTDGTVTWTCVWPGQDMRDYVNQRKSGGAYANYTGSKEPQAAGGGYTRPSGSPEMTAMGALYGTRWSTFQGGSDPLNPHNLWSVELVTGTDGSGSYQWLVCYADTESEYGKLPGDTHTAQGYGPASASIQGAITPPSLQYQFFQRELAKYPGVPKVLCLHWPPFHTGGEWTKVQAFCSMFIQNGCRIIFAGHHHNYQRFVPVDRTFAETSHAGGVLPAESCVLVVVGNSGVDLNGLGTDATYRNMIDLRGTTGTMAGAGTDAATSAFYGCVDAVLDRGGFSLTHVVGADSSGAQITYPAGSNGSIHDTASYTFTASPAPATPTLTPTPSTSPSSAESRSFAFSSATSGVTYERELNGAPLANVTSPEVVDMAAGVIVGSNTYRVRAVKGGVVSGWATHTWTYQPATTTGLTYSPTTGDLGYRIRALVVATNASGSSAAVPTPWSEPVSSGPTLVTNPDITGSLFVGNALTADGGDWDTDPTAIDYQMQSASSSSGPWTDVADVQVVNDTFARTTTTPGDLGSPTTGFGPYTSSLALGTVDGSKAVFPKPGTTPNTAHYTQPTNRRDVRQKMKASMGNLPTGAGNSVGFRLISRYDSVAGDGVYATFSFKQDGSGVLTLGGIKPGVGAQTLATSTPYAAGSIVAGDQWWVESAVDNFGGVPRVRARAWKDGTAVPAWQLTATTDGTWGDASGAVGFGLTWTTMTNSPSSRVHEYDAYDLVSNAYTTLAGDIGKYFSALVTAYTADGSTQVRSNVVGPVVAATAPQNTTPPTLSGDDEDYRVGDTLNTTNGSWDGAAPMTFVQTWERSLNSDAGFLPIPGIMDTVLGSRAITQEDYPTVGTSTTARNWLPIVEATLPRQFALYNDFSNMNSTDAASQWPSNGCLDAMDDDKVIYIQIAFRDDSPGGDIYFDNTAPGAPVGAKGFIQGDVDTLFLAVLANYKAEFLARGMDISKKCAITINHEPANDNTNQGYPGDKAAWARAYIRGINKMIDLIDAAGFPAKVVITNTEGQFDSPSEYGEPAIWYDGAKRLDYVGVDGYLKETSSPFETFRQIMTPAHDFARSRGLPLFIGEFGMSDFVSDGSDAQAKSTWLDDARATVEEWGDVVVLCGQINIWPTQPYFDYVFKSADAAATHQAWVDLMNAPTFQATELAPAGAASGAQYVAVVEDAGYFIRSKITATNGGGTTVAYSAPVFIEPLVPGIPEVPTTTWRWVLCNRDGSPIRDIEPSDRWLEPVVNGSHSAGFTIPLSDEVVPLLEEGRTRLKVYAAAGVLRFHGKVWDITEDTDDAGNGTVEVIAWDQLAQAELHPVESDGVGNAAYLLKDQWTAWTIIQDLVGRLNGNAGSQEGAEIRIGSKFGTGYTTKHRKFEPETSISECILDLTSRADPVDIVCRPVEGDVKLLEWPVGQQYPELVETITLVDVYRRVGGDSDAVFGIGNGTPGNLSKLTRRRAFSTVRNRVLGKGAVIGTRKGSVQRMSDPQLAPTSRSRYGMMAEIADFSDVKAVATLNDKAGSIVRGKAKRELTAVPAPNAPRLFTDFFLGDTVLLVANYQGLQFEQRVRVTRARIEFDEDGNDYLTQITFGVEDE